MLPEGTKYYGCMELHQDGSSHYHVLVKFAKKVRFRNARKRFILSEEDTNAIHFVKMRPGQKAYSFVQGVSDYIDKPLSLEGVEDDGVEVDKPASWFFGERIVEESLVQQRKRKFTEIDEEDDYDVCKKRIREEDPQAFMGSYNNYMNYLNGEKRRKIRPRVRPRYLTEPWKVPLELERWKREYIDERKEGRGGLLILVGPPRSGKTEWGLSFGQPWRCPRSGT